VTEFRVRNVLVRIDTADRAGIDPDSIAIPMTFAADCGCTCSCTCTSTRQDCCCSCTCTCTCTGSTCDLDDRIRPEELVGLQAELRRALAEVETAARRAEVG
jgi:hypothetical protein